jgi:hypothetical protein
MSSERDYRDRRQIPHHPWQQNGPRRWGRFFAAAEHVGKSIQPTSDVVLFCLFFAGNRK